MIAAKARGRHAYRNPPAASQEAVTTMETSQLCPPRVRDAILGARTAFERTAAQQDLSFATEAAEIMGGLTESTELAHALLARPVLASARLTSEQTAGIVGQGATDIAVALQRLGALGLPRDWSPARGLDTRQTETLRKMLLAVVSDPRLVLARLAEELVALRHARARWPSPSAHDARSRPAPSMRHSPIASACGS
jgi:(p)ppGpp synthase/HD superfamily hydrolase